MFFSHINMHTTIYNHLIWTLVQNSTDMTDCKMTSRCDVLELSMLNKCGVPMCACGFNSARIMKWLLTCGCVLLDLFFVFTWARGLMRRLTVQVVPGLHGWPVACHAANLRAYRDRDPPTCCFARHRGAVQCRGSLLSGSLPSRLLLHVHLSPSISTFLHPLPLPPARLLLELARPLMLRMRRDKG